VDDELHLYLRPGEQEGSTSSVQDHPYSAYQSSAPSQRRKVSEEPAPQYPPEPLDEDGGGSSEADDLEKNLELALGEYGKSLSAAAFAVRSSPRPRRSPKPSRGSSQLSATYEGEDEREQQLAEVAAGASKEK
jgi:hypothetical protein